MKDYGRWLMYGGVEYLPTDKVLAHHVKKSKSPPKKQQVRKSILNSDEKSAQKFNDAIIEQNEASKASIYSD
jgi:hypothetical protein